MTKLTLYLLFFLVSLYSGAQTIPAEVGAELKKLNKASQAQTRLQMDITYSVYKDYVSDIILEVTKGKFRRLGKNYISTIGEVTTFSNSRCLVQLNADEQTMVIQNPVPPNPGGQYSSEAIDALAQRCEKFEIQKTAAGDNRLMMFFAKGGVDGMSKVTCDYDTKRYVIKRIVFYYLQSPFENDDGKQASPPRLEILYSNIDINPDFEANTFLESSLFSEHTPGNTRPLGAYKGYSLVDQRTKK